jgi:hypothetical protein
VPPESVAALFDEYVAAYARGERPEAAEYLRRAGAHADALAALLDGFLAAAPVPAPTAEAVELFEAWEQGQTPLLALRTARGVTRDSVVDATVSALSLDPAKRSKVKRYVHELEAGLLEPRRVDRSVLAAIAEAVHAKVEDLFAWRPRPLAVADVYLRAEAPAAAALPFPTEPEEEDEIDRLFHSEC